jgi:Cupin-like domain
MTTIPTVSWGAAGAAGIIRDAVASSTFLLVEHVLTATQCHVITERVRQFGPAQMLVPFIGENIVSFARNEWTDEAIPVASLFLDDDENRTSQGEPPRRLQTRLAIDGIFDHRTDLPNHHHHNDHHNHHYHREDAVVVETLLGGHDLNEDASMVFVTATGLRTPLHSDERHGMLLHIDGVKNFFVIPAAVSDNTHSPDMLRQLLTLRDISGTHRDLYQPPDDEDRPPPASVPTALTNIMDRCYRGTLLPGSALFLPQRNLHDIESVSPTISISLRFGRWDEPNDVE